jgi:hypothetical protein
MKWLIRFTTMPCALLVLLVSLSSAWALTPEQVIALKNAGVSDQTIQLMIRQEQDALAGNPADFSGRKEIKDKDGKTAVIYSTGRPAGNNQAKEEKQTEKAWEMLNNIIIDTRKSK